MYAKWRGWSNGRSAELVGVAQPIVRCGEMGGISRGGEVFQRRVGAPDIVVGDPVGDLGAGVVEIEKQGLVQLLIAHPAIEGLDVAVLHRPTWGDVIKAFSAARLDFSATS